MRVAQALVPEPGLIKAKLLIFKINNFKQKIYQKI